MIMVEYFQYWTENTVHTFELRENGLRWDNDEKGVGELQKKTDVRTALCLFCPGERKTENTFLMVDGERLSIYPRNTRSRLPQTRSPVPEEGRHHN